MISVNVVPVRTTSNTFNRDRSLMPSDHFPIPSLLNWLGRAVTFSFQHVMISPGICPGMIGRAQRCSLYQCKRKGFCQVLFIVRSRHDLYGARLFRQKIDKISIVSKNQGSITLVFPRSSCNPPLVITLSRPKSLRLS